MSPSYYARTLEEDARFAAEDLGDARRDLAAARMELDRAQAVLDRAIVDEMQKRDAWETYQKDPAAFIHARKIAAWRQSAESINAV
jgi:hypothetical protein